MAKGKPLSPTQKQAAARVLRGGGSWEDARKAAKCGRTSIARLMKQDDFLNMLHSRGVLSAGPLRILADDSDTLDDIESDESIMWVSAAETLGTLVVRDDDHTIRPLLRVVFVPPADAERARADIQAHRFPAIPGAPSTVVHSDALQALQDPEQLQLLTTICTADEPTAFRAFLRLWRYRSQERKEVLVLGEDLWPAQEHLIDSILSEPHLMILKARKLGLSTVAIAYCGYALRFRDRNARVHLFSRTEKAALDLLAAVKFGLDNLPRWMQLPKERETMKTLTYDAGVDDRRELVSYPTSDATAVEAQASHSMVDEASDIPRWNVVFSGLEPTLADGTSHIVFTGAGPANPTSEHYRRAQSGDTLHRALFIDALQRPDRDEAWLQRKRKQMLASQFKCEYPMNVEEALTGSSDLVFDSEDVERAHTKRIRRGRYYCRQHPVHWRTDNPGTRCPQCRSYPTECRIVTGWDIGGAGKNADASVGTVLDISSRFICVVKQVRLQGVPYVTLQNAIETLAAEYPRAPVAIEMSGIGAAVRGNLEIPGNRVVEFWTTDRSKARIIGNVALAVQNGEFKFDGDACPNLRSELLGYMTPDDYCVTDCVMSLAVALDQASNIPTPGRLMKVFQI
jgi:hypothetical protein